MARPLWPRIAAGWRWLTGPSWDSKQVEELYGKLTNHGYGGGLVDVAARQESSPVRPAAGGPARAPRRQALSWLALGGRSRPVADRLVAAATGRRPAVRGRADRDPDPAGSLITRPRGQG